MNIIYKAALISIFVCLISVRADHSLIQTYTESNISGNSKYGSVVANVGDINGDNYSDFIVCTSDKYNIQKPIFIYLGSSSLENIRVLNMSTEWSVKGERLNYSAANAGDINDDGYDDIIIGEYNENSKAGRCYILFGGCVLNDQFDLILEPENSHGCFGSAVSSAGDVNGDGYDDVIVGEKDFDSSRGRAYLYYGGSEPDEEVDIVFTGNVSGDHFGHSVSSAGDMDGDGYDDIIIGAIGMNNGEGYVSLFLGGEHMNADPDVVFSKPDGSYYRFGFSISEAGDMNNDGYDDIIIGSSSDLVTVYSTKWYNAGTAYLYLGGSTVDNQVDVIFSGAGQVGNFGYSVSCAGDINGDTFSDIVIGNFAHDSWRGRVSVFYGSPVVDPVADVVILPEKNTRVYFGYSVSGAGDINDDGFDDLIIGGPLFKSWTGKVYLYKGGSEFDAEVDMVFTGECSNNEFGNEVLIAGDVNGDGFDDILVSATNYDESRGQVYLYFGGPVPDNHADLFFSLGPEAGHIRFGSTLTAGDFNNDGFMDVAIGTGAYQNNKGIVCLYWGGENMDAEPDLIFTGLFNNCFGSSIACAGDVNGDGFDDLIVGEGGGKQFTGRAYLFYGGSDMDNEHDLFLLGSGGAYNRFGHAVSSAGDVNKDGYDDLLIGDYTFNNSTGRVYLFFGGPDMDKVPDFIVDGEEEGDEFGHSVASAGDLNGFGYDDIIIGATGAHKYDGRVYVYFGEVLFPGRADIVLDDGWSDSQFGEIVTGTGDINGDGYDDVIGTSLCCSFKGKVDFFYGGVQMDGIPDITILGQHEWSFWGGAVSAGGDVNGDGNIDFLIGARGDSSNGKAYLYSLDLFVGIDELNMSNYPSKVTLKSPCPNPFNCSTRISYELCHDTVVDLKIYDILGRCIKVIRDNEFQMAGLYSVNWTGKNDSERQVSSGVYLVVLKTGSKVITQKLVMIR